MHEGTSVDPRARTSGRASTVRGFAQCAAVFALIVAVIRFGAWGNRWYVSTQMPMERAHELLTAAHAALLSGLGWLLAAVLLAAWGWRLRIGRSAVR